MPRSRRVRTKALTETESRTREDKELLIDGIRDSVEKYDHVYVFHVHNMRNNALKSLRAQFRDDGKFFFGKNKVFQVACGKTPETEIAENIHFLCEYVRGECGILMTNRTYEQISEFFEGYEIQEYARTGFVPDHEVVIASGELEQFTHSHFDLLKRLGMPVSLDKGKIYLKTDYKVSTIGKPLTANQANILKQFGIQLAVFRIEIVCQYDKKEAEFMVFAEEEVHVDEKAPIEKKIE
ncbi:hypothetical protein PCE1_000970 [Barthelona sp. PCE]